MESIFQVLRHDTGEVEIHIGTQSTAAARRLLIDAAHTVNALDDIDTYDDPGGSTPTSAARDTLDAASTAGDEGAEDVLQEDDA